MPARPFLQCFIQSKLRVIDLCVVIGFLTGVLQVHARKYGLPIDRLTFKYHMLPTYRDQQEVTEAEAKLQYGEQLEEDKVLVLPADGILIHGLFMDGFRWDDDNMILADSLPGQMNSALPMMHMEPMMDFEAPEEDYQSPLYKTSARAGTLSTTGQSVLSVYRLD